MKITYDKQADAIYIYFQKGKVKKTVAMSDDFIEHIRKPSFVAIPREFRAKDILFRRGIAKAISRRKKWLGAESIGGFAEYRVSEYALDQDEHGTVLGLKILNASRNLRNRTAGPSIMIGNKSVRLPALAA